MKKFHGVTHDMLWRLGLYALVAFIYMSALRYLLYGTPCILFGVGSSPSELVKSSTGVNLQKYIKVNWFYLLQPCLCLQRHYMLELEVYYF